MPIKKLLLIAMTALLLFCQGYSLVSGVNTAGGQLSEALEDLDLEEIVPSDPFLPSITQRCWQASESCFSQLIGLALFIALTWLNKSNSQVWNLFDFFRAKKPRQRPLWLLRQKLIL